MRRTLLAGIALCAMAGPAHAQIAVRDDFALLGQAKALYQDLKNYAVYLQQAQTMAQQLGWAINTFHSLVANPNLGTVQAMLNQLGMGDALPIDPYTVMSLMHGTGGMTGILGSLSTLANTSFGTNHVYAPTDNSWASQQMIANAHGIANSQGMAQTVHQALAARFPLLQELQAQMAGATTPAQRESVMGQIQAEQAWTQSMNGQLQALTILASVERDNRSQQADEQIRKSFDNEVAQAKANGVL